eukprot:scaffold227296_cov32-Tisochrysis_lutea.AAC.1
MPENASMLMFVCESCYRACGLALLRVQKTPKRSTWPGSCLAHRFSQLRAHSARSKALTLASLPQ